MTDATMTVAARKERVVEIDQRLAEIDYRFMGGALDQEHRSEWDELIEERTGHNEAIADAERREAQLEKFAGEHTEGEVSFEGDEERKSSKPSFSTEKARSVQVNAGRKVKNLYDLNEYRNSTSSEDGYRAAVRDGAKRAIDQAVIHGYGVDEDKAKENATKLLQSVDSKARLARRVLQTGSEIYQRAFGKAVMGGGVGTLSPEEHRALSSVDAEGGFAVPFALDPTVVLTSDGSINPLRQISRQVQITNDTWQGVTSAGISVSRAGEGDEAGDDSPTLAQPSVTPTRVHGFVPFSIEIDQDWSALRSEITMMLQEAKDDEEATAFVTGSGVDPNPNGVVSTLPGGSEVASADPTSFTSPDPYNVAAALPPRFRQRASWMATIEVYNELRQFASADGHDLWERIGADQPALLLGKRAYESSAMESDTTTATNRVLLYGDFSKFLIVDRVGMNVELVPHLFHTDNNRPTGQRGIYAIWRNSSLVLVPNAFRVLTISA